MPKAQFAEFVKLFVAICPAGDPGDTSSVIGYYTTKHNAEVGGADKGAWGGKPDIGEADAVLISGKYYILANKKPVGVDVGITAAEKALKEKLLAKLQPEERELLTQILMKEAPAPEE